MLFSANDIQTFTLLSNSCFSIRWLYLIIQLTTLFTHVHSIFLNEWWIFLFYLIIKLKYAVNYEKRRYVNTHCLLCWSLEVFFQTFFQQQMSWTFSMLVSYFVDICNFSGETYLDLVPMERNILSYFQQGFICVTYGVQIYPKCNIINTFFFFFLKTWNHEALPNHYVLSS